MYANVAFKTGVKAFHNTIMVGSQFDKSNFRWALGYGAGSEVGLGNKFCLNFDLLSMHISENETFTTTLNMINKLGVTFGWKLSNKATLYGGPTYNVMVSSFYNSDTKTYGSHLGPNGFFNETYDTDDINLTRVNVKMWLGCNAGLRF
jgi:hypothetical protein